MSRAKRTIYRILDILEIFTFRDSRDNEISLGSKELLHLIGHR